MNFLKKIINKPVTISLIVLIVLILGIYSTYLMPVSLLPDLNIPILGVTVVYPGASSETVESELTKPLEEALSTVASVTKIQSYSIENASVVVAYFDYDTSLDEKKTEIKDLISKLSLPSVCYEPTISSVDFNASSVATISFVSDSDDTEKLKEASAALEKKIKQIDEVGSVSIKGLPTKNINVSPIKGLELTTLLIVEALSTKQLDIPLGSFTNEDGSTVFLKNSSFNSSLRDLADTTVKIELEKSAWDEFLTLQKQINAILDKNISDDEINSLLSYLSDLSFDEMKDITSSLLILKDKIDNISSDDYNAENLKNKYAPLVKVYGIDLTTSLVDAFRNIGKASLVNITDTLLSYKQKGTSVSYDLINFIKNLDFTKISYDGNLGTYICPLFNTVEDNETLVLKPNLAKIEEVLVYDTFAFYNGHIALNLEVYQKSGSNTSKIVKEVKKLMKEYSFDGVSMTLLDDQASFIDDSISNVLSSMLIGGALAIVVIFLFLKKVRPSIVIAITMPLSILSSLVVLHLLGVTLNMVSLGGLAVGIGMLVDNSIVVIEAITKKREEKSLSVKDAAFLATKEVSGSLFASTLTTICVFIPIMFIKGLTKEIFTDLSLAVILSLTNSFIVAIFVIPTLYALFYKVKDEKPALEKATSKMEKGYQKILEKALKKPVIVISSLLICFLLSITLVVTRGIEFLPPSDKGQLEVNMSFDSLTSLDEANNDAQRALDIINENIDDIEFTSVVVGTLGLIKTNISASILIQLKDGSEKTKVVKDKITSLLQNEKINASVKEIDGIVASITSGFNDLSITINGKDEELLKTITKRLEEELLKNKNITSVSDNITSLASVYHLEIDKTKCKELNIDYQVLVKTLRVGFSGYDVDTIKEDGETVSVIVKFLSDSVSSTSDLENLRIGFYEGADVTLKDVGRLSKSQERVLILKDNMLPSVQLTIQTKDIDTGSASRIINKITKDVLKDYEGYTAITSGVQAYLNDAFKGLVVALIISVFLLFAVMACQFESLTKPLIIMASIPLTFTGAFLALTISNVSLNIVSFIGIIMLMGVIVNNAIIMLDEIKRLNEVENYKHYDAVIKGCTNRLRPILMTTLTTILAVVPLSLGLGRGGELMQPMGIVVIGGLLVGTIVTLLLIPSIYCLTKKIKKE